jgi:hypothetical protein
MKLKLAAVAVALLLFATGAAMATPGDAPDHAQADNYSQAEENAPDDPADDADDADDSDEDGADEADADDDSDAADDERRGPPADVPMVGGDAADASGSQGPPAELPGSVPDFVSDIHSAIHGHLDGSMESGDLGDVISALTPDEDDNEGNVSDASGAASQFSSATRGSSTTNTDPAGSLSSTQTSPP